MRCDNLKVINIGTTTFDPYDDSLNQGFPFAYNKNLETINFFINLTPLMVYHSLNLVRTH